MSNSFEKLKQDRLREEQEKQAEAAKEATKREEMYRAAIQYEQTLEQEESRYNELVMSVLRELQAAVYPTESVHRVREWTGGGMNLPCGWGIGVCCFTGKSRDWDKGVHIMLVRQNGRPICFRCRVQKEYRYAQERCTAILTRGLTRQELVEVLTRVHS